MPSRQIAAALDAPVPVPGPLEGCVVGVLGADTRVLPLLAAVGAVAQRPGSGRLWPDALLVTEAEGALAAVGAVLGERVREVLVVCPDRETAERLRSGLGADAVHASGLGPEALVAALAEELPYRAQRFVAAGHVLELRGRAALVDGRLRRLSPAAITLLRVLSRHPGWVVPRTDLLQALPGAGTDPHAVESAIARLRVSLGDPRLIHTVVKRGYRLATD